MQLLSTIQYTLHHIFELYKKQGKRWYGFSMLFTIFSILLSTLFTSLLLYGYYSVEQMLRGNARMSPFVWEMLLSNDLMIYAQFMMVLTFSLYGLFIYRQEQAPATDKITFSGFFKNIGSDTLWMYFLFTVGGIVVSKFTHGLLNPSFYDPGSSFIDRLSSPLTEWFYSLLQFLLNQLPIVLAFVLIRRHLSKQGIDVSGKKAWTAFFALLIVYFVINNFSVDIVYFVSNYVLKLIMIPFTEPLIPSILSIAVYVFLIAVFAAGIAGSLIYPFTFRNEQLPVNDDVIDE